MGWTADFAYDCNTINEELVKNTSAYMAVNGLVAAGYKYVNVGECWMNLKREANGSLIADPTRFPNGLAGLYQNLSAADVKLGISQSAGTATCSSGRPGSSGSVTIDANDWSSWGVSYVKYSNCNNKVAALDTF